MDTDYTSDQRLYNSHIDVIKKKDVINKNKNLEKNLKRKIIKKLNEILSNKYSYNKYYKIYPVTGRVNFIIQIIKNYLFPKDLLFLIKKKGLFGDKICVKFYNPIKYPNHIKKKFNKFLNTCIKKNYKRLCIKRYIHEKNLMTAECYVRNFNIILGNSGYIFDLIKYVVEYSYYSSSTRKYIYVKKNKYLVATDLQ
ncbi:hypothetical protein ma493 [Moumouvirus australiensis]|uniref:Uncharacterized protein n=1 Tax=Moumouvirus australiensis TaxID=2109587 RepID=A0A2P1ELX7_9VIRU|nr:hypothetical protein QKC55_gp412 [Moumouvirus australiensis]AVL94879.1 hypothetical protein ma493 [Moumouvirus australiensis]